MELGMSPGYFEEGRQAETANTQDVSDEFMPKADWLTMPNSSPYSDDLITHWLVQNKEWLKLVLTRFVG